MCTVLLPPGDNPIAVNKYIISKYSVDQIEKNRMAGADKTYREKRIASLVLGGKLQGKRSFGRTGFRYNIFTMDLTFGRNSVDTFSTLKFGQLGLSHCFWHV